MLKRIFILAAALGLFLACAPKQATPKVMARAVPERADDFVFENNLIAGRFYGKALEGNPTSPGIDIWVKLPGALVADEWYKNAVEGDDANYYHRDHGGKDCYKVAVSLGGGASAPLIDGTLRYPTTNYRSCEVLVQTPDSVTFVLHYPAWDAAEGISVALDKEVTVVADSYFCQVRDTWTFTGTDSLTVAAGFKLHNAQPTVEASLQEVDRLAIGEHASDQSVEPEEGMIGVAVVMPGAEDSFFCEELDHALLTRTIVSGEEVSYCFGSCWSKGDITQSAAWFQMVSEL